MATTVNPPAHFQAADWPPLPAEDAPVVEIVEDLRKRADAGDHAAACRLGSELNQCAVAIDLWPLWEKQLNRPLESDQNANTLKREESVIADLEASLALYRRCAGLSPEQLAMGPRYVRQAAHQGSIDAIAQYVAMGPFPYTRMLQDGESFRQFLDEREPLLWAGLEAGSEAALREVYFSVGNKIFVGMQSPQRPALTRAEQSEMRFLLGELVKLMGTERELSSVLSEIASPTTASPLPPTEVQPRLRAKAEKLFAGRWADSLPDDSDLPRSQLNRRCSQFVAPPNLRLGWQAVLSQ